ncbi:hypothetical protein [Nostoc phage A1]|nr:hypothetical protein [Nostoc phage A1]
MIINGVNYHEKYLNRLLQIGTFPQRFDKLLTKPVRYYVGLKKRPKAIAKLKFLITYPLPTDFLVCSKQFEFLVLRSTTKQKIEIVGHYENRLKRICQLIEKLELPLTKKEKQILKELQE